MHVYGITGPSGSGKSMLCAYFESMGIPHMNADDIYHEMLVPPSPLIALLCDAFGDEIKAQDGSIDRKALSAIVFQDPEKLTRLNTVVLDSVLQEIRQRIAALEALGYDAVALDAPTLIESGFHRECETVIVVLAEKEQRILRIMERDHLSRSQAEARIHAQHEDAFYEKEAHVVLHNDQDRDALYAQASSALFPSKD